MELVESRAPDTLPQGLSPSPGAAYGMHTTMGDIKPLEQKELCVIPAKAGIQETSQLSG